MIRTHKLFGFYYDLCEAKEANPPQIMNYFVHDEPHKPHPQVIMCIALPGGENPLHIEKY